MTSLIFWGLVFILGSCWLCREDILSAYRRWRWAVPVVVRRAESGDAGKIATIIQNSWVDTYSKSPQWEKIGPCPDVLSEGSFYKRLSPEGDKDGVVYLVAMQNDQIVGAVSVTFQEDKKFALLGLLYVDPSAQGTGAGTALCSAAENFFPPAEYVLVEVIQDNAQAIEFYESRGFYQTRIPEKVVHQVDVVWLAKALRPN